MSLTVKTAVLAFLMLALAACGQSAQEPAGAELVTLETALKVASMIEEPQDRDRVLSEIAVGFTQADQLERAEMATGQIQGEVDKGWTEAAVAAGYAAEGQAEKANAGFVRALVLADEVDDTEEKGWMLSEIADRYRQADRVSNALELLDQVESMATSLDTPQKQAWLLAEVGGNLGAAGKTERADEAFARADALGEQMQNPLELMQLKLWMADRLEKAGRTEQAAEYLLKSDQLLQQLEGSIGANQMSLDLSEIARIYGLLDNTDQAQTLLEAAQEFTDTIEDPFEHNRSQLVIAETYNGLGMHEKAKSLLGEVSDALESIEHPVERKVLVTMLSMGHAEAGDFTRALTQAATIDAVYDQSWALTRIGAAFIAADTAPDKEHKAQLKAITDTL